MTIDKIDFNSTHDNIFPSENTLSSISYRTSLNISLKKSLSKISEEQLLIDIENAINYLSEKCFSINYINRIKSLQSCILKYKKNIVKGNSIMSTFNDLLGIRIIVDEYPKHYPKYVRVVDMTNGKKYDDGYRGVHLYYQKDNYHYPIEIQINTKKDRLFADLTHKYLYKRASVELSLSLRDKFDKGLINNEKEFLKELDRYDKGNCCKEI